MYRVVGLTLVFAVAALARAGDAKSGGVKFRSQAGKFTVVMPAEPKPQTQQVPTPLGPLDVHMFLVDQGDRAYLVGYSDYPAGSVSDENRAEVLEGAVNGSAQSLKGAIVSKEKFTLKRRTVEGREIVIEFGEPKMLYRARVFLVGSRLYQVVVLGPASFTNGAAARAYLGSFKLDD